MSKGAYYSEIDPYAAQWLRNLIAAGLIAPGDVDERDIRDVRPSELRPYTQCHFFAGIAGWALALQYAGWPATRPVWTGSCPCQPFSIAGKRAGAADERHLWPEFFRLISECKPSTVFGEQVASKDGRLWLSGVRTDLEAVGYAVGAADLCAAGISAPHIRQRLFWVADSRSQGLAQRERNIGVQCKTLDAQEGEAIERSCTVERLGIADGHGCASRCETSATSRYWDSAITADCRDGKRRRIPAESAFFPLADGIPARVVRLRGYGNAIVPQVAAEFILAADAAQAKQEALL